MKASIICFSTACRAKNGITEFKRGVFFTFCSCSVPQTGFERNDLSNPPGKEDRPFSASPSEEAATAARTHGEAEDVGEVVRAPAIASFMTF